MDDLLCDQVVEFLKTQGFDQKTLLHAKDSKMTGKQLKKVIATGILGFSPTFVFTEPVLTPDFICVSQDTLPDTVTKAIVGVLPSVKQMMDKMKIQEIELGKKSGGVCHFYFDWASIITDAKLKDCFEKQCNNKSFGEGMIASIEWMIGKYFVSKPKYVWEQMKVIVLKNDPVIKDKAVFTNFQGCIVVSYSMNSTYGWPMVVDKAADGIMSAIALPDDDLGHGITLAQKFKFEPLKRDVCNGLINHINTLQKFLAEKGLAITFNVDMDGILSKDKPHELLDSIGTRSPIFTSIMQDALVRFNKQYFADDWKAFASQTGWKSCSIFNEDTVAKGTKVEFENGVLKMSWVMRNVMGYPSRADEIFDHFTKVFPTKPVDLGYGLNTGHLKRFSTNVQSLLTKMLVQKIEDNNKKLKEKCGFTINYTIDYDSILAHPNFNEIAETFVSGEPSIPNAITETIIWGQTDGHWYWSEHKDWLPSKFKKMHIVYDPQIRSNSIKDGMITIQYPFSRQGFPYSKDVFMGVIDSLIGIPAGMKIWGGLVEQQYSLFSWTSKKMIINTLKPRVEGCLKLARELKVEQRSSEGEPTPVLKITKIKMTDLNNNRKGIAERVKAIKNLLSNHTSGIESFDDAQVYGGEFRVTYKDQESANAALKKFKSKDEIQSIYLKYWEQIPDFTKYGFEIVKKVVHLSKVEQKSTGAGLELEMTFDWDSVLTDTNIDRTLECFATFERDEATERVTYGWKMIVDVMVDMYTSYYSKSTPNDFYNSFAKRVHFVHHPEMKSDNVWHPNPPIYKKIDQVLQVDYDFGGYGFAHRLGETKAGLKKVIKVPTIDPGFTGATGFLKYGGLDLTIFGKLSEKSQGFIGKTLKERVEKTLKHLNEATGLTVEISVDWQSILNDSTCTEKICEHFSTFRRDGVNYGFRAFSHGIRSVYQQYWAKGSEFPIKRVHFVNKTGGVPSFDPEPATVTFKDGVITVYYHMIGWGYAVSDGETVQDILKIVQVPFVDKGFGLTSTVMSSFATTSSLKLFDLYIKRMQNIQADVPHATIAFDFSTLEQEPLKERVLDWMATLNYGTIEIIHSALREIPKDSLKTTKIILKHVVDSRHDLFELIKKDDSLILSANWNIPSCCWTKGQFIDAITKLQ